MPAYSWNVRSLVRLWCEYSQNASHRILSTLIVVVIDINIHPPTHKVSQVMKEEDGYPAIFYVMLVIGIIGLLGFFMVAGGAAGGM